MELTKFKLSLLNSVGAFTMFYYHAPLAGIGLMNGALFLFATQTVAWAALRRGLEPDECHAPEIAENA